MSLGFGQRKSMNFLVTILVLQFIVYITVFFNIPVARQVISFAYFTFIPGFLFLKILKLDKLDQVETILYSVGFSIAFLMLISLLVNEFSLLLGFSQPLSLTPLMLALNCFILFGAVIAHLRNDVEPSNSNNQGLHPLSILFIGLPILSVVGALWVNAFDSNLLLIFLLTIVPLLFVIAVISRRLVAPKLYPVIVLMISISLLLHASMISSYIVSFEADVPLEHFIFTTTQNMGYWNSTNLFFGSNLYGRFDSMLSITVLPTVYSTILNLDSTWTFKIIFPLIFSLVPLALYQLWKGQAGKKVALISAFLFMAQATFYTEMLGLNRQMIAELFFALLLLVILNNKLKNSGKTACFTIFSFGLVTSHYGLSIIFLFLLAFVYIFLLVLKRSSRKITATMISLFFVIMFLWYIFVSGTAVFDSILEFGDSVYAQLGDFFNPASRGVTVLRGLGLESPPTVWHSISRGTAYAIQLLIVVGFIGIITNRIKTNVKWEYIAFSSIAMTFLATLILVPGLANTLNMTRFYHILLFVLAPLCVLGAQTITNLVSKRKPELIASILLLIVVVPYFLFQTNLMYEVAGTDSYSLPLSKYRMTGTFLRVELGYFEESEVFGAVWVSKNVNTKNSWIYADVASASVVLTAYGMVTSGQIEYLSNVTMLYANSTVYLNRANLVDGIIVGPYYLVNTTSISPKLDLANKVYSNGGSEIYKIIVDS